MDLSLIPILLVLLVPVLFLIYRSIKSRQKARLLKEKGIGRGAAGFQTNVRRIAVPPEIAARIRRGEQVSAEEITEAQERAKRQEEGANGEAAAGKKSKVDDEWLPASAKKADGATGTGKRRKR